MVARAQPDAEYGDRRGPNNTYGKLETRGRKRGSVDVAALQAKSLEYFGQGYNVPQTMAKLGRTPAAYQSWRGKTPGYAEAVDHIKAKLNGLPTKEVGDFESFRKEYLGQETFWHQRQWIDLLEGREPSDLHEAQVYRPGRDSRQRMLINTPPNHGKSTTITMDYVTYRICKNPAFRVLILSASATFAKKFMLGIKTRLTHPQYGKLIADFGPSATGFRDPDMPWNDTFFYVAGRDPEQKDPTVEAIGINGQIYGARADMIVMDDCVTLKTSRTKGGRDRLLELIRSEIMSRLEPANVVTGQDAGRLLIVGTRLSFDDMYGEIIRQDERGAWTYLTQPAILEYGETPAEHVTLWPERFDGLALDDIMADHGQDLARFRLVYQQEAAAEDAVFPEPAIRGCTYPGGCGFLPDNVRPGGMQGLYVVAGLDPAASGHTAIVVVGVDKKTKMRYVIDTMNVRGIKPHILREKMIEFTKKYKINEWRIEKNGLQTLLSQDRDLRIALIGEGSRIYEHHTLEYGATGKWDPDYGVATLAPLFLGALEVPKANKIAIPFNGAHRATRELLDQLIAWEPGTVGKTDLVMALWFADLGCRKQLEVGMQTHAPNRWASSGRMAQRNVINIQDWLGASA